MKMAMATSHKTPNDHQIYERMVNRSRGDGPYENYSCADEDAGHGQFT